jgi:predicted amino acid dehydrogenase
VTPRSTFAFLVHPRTDVRADLAGVWRPLGSVPNVVYEHVLRLPLPPSSVGAVHIAPGAEPPLGAEATPHPGLLGHLILVPRTPRQLLAQRGAAAGITRSRLAAAVDVAAGLGADFVGLGALTAPASAGGRALQGHREIGLTNGNAFTAAVTADQVQALLPHAPQAGPAAGVVAVVGATGSVGTALTRELVRRGLSDRLLLVARNRARLAALGAELAPAVQVQTSTDIGDIRGAGLVVLLTSAADAVVRADHLAAGAVVLDDTQPRNTSPDLARTRPDVLVVDGGVVAAPGLRLSGTSIGLPPGLVYACLAETALLALAGHRGDFSVGHPTPDQVAHVGGLARRFRSLGFTPAAPRSFGRPVPLTPREVAA